MEPQPDGCGGLADGIFMRHVLEQPQWSRSLEAAETLIAPLVRDGTDWPQ
jgi:hypothetical protein